MKPIKRRATIWLTDAVFDAAKAKAAATGVSLSETLAKAAEESLLRNRKEAEAEISRQVERIYFLLQKTDRKRGYEIQVIRELIGLAILSFFNHTPPVDESHKKAALLDGKMRFERLLNVAVANLTGGKSILRHLPGVPQEKSATSEKAETEPEVNQSKATSIDNPPPAVLPEPPKPEPSDPPPKENSKDLNPNPSEQKPRPDTPPDNSEQPPKKKWSLF